MANGKALVGRMVVGRFRVTALIGEGAMATIYRAVQLDPPRLVALKLVRPEMASDETAVARFHREAKAASRLEHPGSARIYDVGVYEGRPYLAMELVDGEDLFALLARHRTLSQLQAVRVAMAICDVLDAAHQLGIVHRDLKPENVMLARDGADVRVKVLDFGVAKLMASPNEWSDTTKPEALTKVGSTVGTPTHMAPEQARGGPIDGRVDLYACGVILYEMLTGRVPFEGSDALATAVKQVREPPTPPSHHRPELHPELERVVLKCLEKSPDARWPSAVALRAELARLAAMLEVGEDEELTTDLLPAIVPVDTSENDPTYELGRRAPVDDERTVEMSSSGEDDEGVTVNLEPDGEPPTRAKEPSLSDELTVDQVRPKEPSLSDELTIDQVREEEGPTVANKEPSLSDLMTVDQARAAVPAQATTKEPSLSDLTTAEQRRPAQSAREQKTAPAMRPAVRPPREELDSMLARLPRRDRSWLSVAVALVAIAAAAGAFYWLLR